MQRRRCSQPTAFRPSARPAGARRRSRRGKRGGTTRPAVSPWSAIAAVSSWPSLARPAELGHEQRRPDVATLRHHRPLPLAMEAIGWLHMTGKAHPDFLRQQGGQNMRYDYKGWHERENPPFDWDSLLCWVTNKFNQIDSKQIWSPKTFTEFVTKHDGGDGIGVLGLLQAAHGITSGIEKNLSRSTSEYLKQDIAHMWLASPFGHPVRNLLADPPELLAPGGWQRVIDEIRRMLGD